MSEFSDESGSATPPEVIVPVVAATSATDGMPILPPTAQRVRPERPIRIMTVPAELESFLGEMDGQDTYDSTAAALTTLPKRQFMVLPDTLALDEFIASEVGTTIAKRRIARADLFHIAALNYGILTDADDSVRCTFALTRAFAVAVGWRITEGEVTRSTIKATELVTEHAKLTTFALNNPDTVKLIERAAYVLPMLMRQVFHTTGHHYLDHMKAEYEAKYAVILNAMLMPTIASLLPKSILYHTVLHWVSPKFVVEFYAAAENEPNVAARIPNALWMRRNAAPAGSALITTSTAVLESMDGPGFTKIIEKVYKKEIDEVRVMAKKVREDPNKYHITSRAYGVAALTVAERQAMEAAKTSAKVISPVCQAYINAYASQGSLAAAAALRKCALESPFFLRVIEQWFRAFAKKQKEVTSLADLLRGDVVVDSESLDVS